jgi:two-component system chemotaxis response regulator CheY
MAAKALVLDDSRAMRGVLTKILIGLGFETVQAANGREALALLDREGDSIQLVLADWNMPEMNGLEFVKGMRAQSRFDAIQVIMVTTETGIDHMLGALHAGANEYLMKPFTGEMIAAKLRILGIGPGIDSAGGELAHLEPGQNSVEYDDQDSEQKQVFDEVTPWPC